MADSEGAIWVQEYPTPGSADQGWNVFGAQRARIGQLRLEAKLVLLDAGSNYLLVKAEDESGLESVRAYRLERRE